jgi:hypothetical protein
VQSRSLPLLWLVFVVSVIPIGLRFFSRFQIAFGKRTCSRFESVHQEARIPKSAVHYERTCTIRFQKFSFGSIRIDGTTYEHDVVIDRGKIRKRKKKPSKKFREAFGHTPISIEEQIPWECKRLVIGTGTELCLSWKR